MTDSSLHDTQIVDITAQPTVAVRIQRSMDELDLAAAFDRYMPLVMARVEAEGGSIAGSPFGRYHRFGPDLVDVEIGFPVVTILTGLPPLDACAPGDVGVSALPGGLVARTVHRGPYDGLSKTYDVLHAWIHEQPGYDDGAGPWETYVDDPSAVADPGEVRTEVTWPLVVLAHGPG